MKVDAASPLQERELQPTDLRGILKYVPQWRHHTFVVALDGATVAGGDFGNLALQLAVLANLNIRLILVYGIGQPLENLARERHIAITDARGEGPTDAATLALAVEASAQIGHQLTRGLTQNGLRVAMTNAVRGTERGVLGGVDQLAAGKVDKVDTDLLRHLHKEEIIPIIAPIAFNREGETLRLNSDRLAADIAITHDASKLIYLMPYDGLTLGGKLVVNVDVEAVEGALASAEGGVDAIIRGKAEQALRAIQTGATARAHLLDSRIHDGLLMEIFSKVGIGTMIHRDPYTQLRPATRKDVGAILTLTRHAVAEETLRARTRREIAAAIEEYVVHEIDDGLIGCARLTPLNDGQAEFGSLLVHPAYQGRQIGQGLVQFCLSRAEAQGWGEVFALSTQTAPFFKAKFGFVEADVESLPEALKHTAARTQRNARALVWQS